MATIYGIFIMILLCLTHGITRAENPDADAKQRDGGNIWDMMINSQEYPNEYFQELPSYNSPTVYKPSPVYGVPKPQPAPTVVYGPPRPVVPIASTSNVGFSLGAQGSLNGLLRPHEEILRLVEILIKLKGEVASRVYAVLADNWDLIRAVFSTIVSKLGTLQAFTLNGIIILRKILEFALRLFGNWQITVPNVSVDFSSLLRENNIELNNDI